MSSKYKPNQVFYFDSLVLLILSDTCGTSIGYFIHLDGKILYGASALSLSTASDDGNCITVHPRNARYTMDVSQLLK
jgi:hypothetical protein